MIMNFNINILNFKVISLNTVLLDQNTSWLNYLSQFWTLITVGVGLVFISTLTKSSIKTTHLFQCKCIQMIQLSVFERNNYAIIYPNGE